VQGVGKGDERGVLIGLGVDAGGGVVETSNIGVGCVIGVGVAVVFATGDELHAVATSTSPRTAPTA
jgi:hypothetical protein